MTDRRYGVNKYGDGALYGPSSTRDALAWDVSIDWDGDGLLETNDADRLVGVSVNRGRTRLLGNAGSGFEAISTGTCVLTFRNHDGRFDGWNESSPLYPNVGYGKELRVRVRDLNTGTIHPLFFGVITDIVPSGYGVDAEVSIHASDGFEYLRNSKAGVAIQTSITPDGAMDKILDSVLWPPRWGRSLESSVQTMPYWWASGNKQALSELEDIALSFLGYFFIDVYGRARYLARTNVSSSVMDFEQGELLKDIGNPQPYEIRRNITRLKVHPRIAANTGVIWELAGNTPSVGAGDTLTMFANYTYSSAPTPAINVVSPVATTDFLVNTVADGSGTNLTASCTVALSDFGDTARLVITNNSGSTGYITFLQVRGKSLYEPNVTDVTYPTDTSSFSNPRELLFDLPWQQDINTAIDLANVLGPHYAGMHPIPNIKLSDRAALQFPIELFDIVTLSVPKIGLTGNSFRVGGIEHSTNGSYKNCQSVQTRFYLEPYITSDNYMQWDTKSVWDTSTIFGW
jgi:hypothetical protein